MAEAKISNQRNRSSQNNEVIYVQDSIIEEMFINYRTGNITISYGNMGDSNTFHINLVTLIINQDTIIKDRFGRDLALRDLKEGMIVNAEFSSAMTKSIPPQARAYRIIVVDKNRSTYVRLDKVLSVDLINNILDTGNADDMSGRMIDLRLRRQLSFWIELATK